MKHVTFNTQHSDRLRIPNHTQTGFGLSGASEAKVALDLLGDSWPTRAPPAQEATRDQG